MRRGARCGGVRCGSGCARARRARLLARFHARCLASRRVASCLCVVLRVALSSCVRACVSVRAQRVRILVPRKIAGVRPTPGRERPCVCTHVPGHVCGFVCRNADSHAHSVVSRPHPEESRRAYSERSQPRANYHRRAHTSELVASACRHEHEAGKRAPLAGRSSRPHWQDRRTGNSKTWQTARKAFLPFSDDPSNPIVLSRGLSLVRFCPSACCPADFCLKKGDLAWSDKSEAQGLSEETGVTYSWEHGKFIKSRRESIFGISSHHAMLLNR